MLIDIPSSDSLIVAPELEPLTLDDVKSHLRFSNSTSQDTLLGGDGGAGWIAGARQMFEAETGRQLITATWEYQLDRFPLGPIELPHPPLQRVLSVSYIDANGDLKLFGDEGMSPFEPWYDVQAPQGPEAIRGLIRPKYGRTYPVIRPSLGAVKVLYKAGYGDEPADVPAIIRSALYMLVGQFFKFRTEDFEAVRSNASIDKLSMNARSILRSYVSRPVWIPQQYGPASSWWSN